MSQPLENFSHRSYVSLYNYFPTCSKMNSRPHIFPLFEYQSGNDSIYLPIKAMITARPLYWKDFSRLLNNPRKRLVISRLETTVSQDVLVIIKRWCMEEALSLSLVQSPGDNGSEVNREERSRLPSSLVNRGREAGNTRLPRISTRKNCTCPRKQPAVVARG